MPSKSHGKSFDPVYKIWLQMKQRCLNPSNWAYPHYGGRGITVCDRWRDNFPAFEADMGPRPEKYTLERIDTNGPYAPENCRWASRQEQMHNLRSTRYIQIEGLKFKAVDLARATGMKTDTIVDRAKTCTTMEELLDTKRRVNWEGLRKAPNFAPRTHCPHGHPLSGDNLYITSRGFRQCIACSRENTRRYRAERRTKKD